jgi:hypothetical protein
MSLPWAQVAGSRLVKQVKGDLLKAGTTSFRIVAGRIRKKLYHKRIFLP